MSSPIASVPPSPSNPQNASPAILQERELLRAWRSGDERAGDRLLLRLQSRMRRYFRACGPTTAEDLTQEVLISWVRARHTLRDERALHAYVYTAARRILARELRARERRPESFDETITPESLSISIDTDHLDVARLLECDGMHTPMLTEYFVEGLRASEIARIHQLPESTVRSRIRYGLEALRRRSMPRPKQALRSPRDSRRPGTGLQRNSL